MITTYIIGLAALAYVSMPAAFAVACVVVIFTAAKGV